MKCLRCKAEAEVELKYSGHQLCRRHFLELFEKRVKKAIRQNRLIESADKVLVGLSGGKDSMTALKLLNDVTGPNPKTRLIALSIDEGIRGKGLQRASRYCESLDVEHHITSFQSRFGFTLDEAMAETDDILACSVCGVLKRRLLNDFAKEQKATKVATGHNLDDEIQSAFMNIVRGDLPRMARLGAEVGVARHRGFTPRIKVLRQCLEQEVRLYAGFQKLPYTSRRCPYARSSYRSTARKLLDQLEQRHPGSKYQMLNSVDDFTKIMKERTEKQKPAVCMICKEPSSGNKCKVCSLLEKLK